MKPQPDAFDMKNMILADPLNRLKAFEMALIFSIVMTGSMFGLWAYLSVGWLVYIAVFFLLNTLALLFRYIKERREYKKEGGDL